MQGGPSPGAVGSPPFRGSIWEPSGAGSCLSMPSPGGAGCRPPVGAAVRSVRGPKQDGHPLSVAAASSRCRHERAQLPTEAGPIRRVDRRGLGRSAPWGLRAAPGVPSSTTPTARGASWAGPAALYPDWFGARGRHSQREAGGLGLCFPRPCPADSLKPRLPPCRPSRCPTGAQGLCSPGLWLHCPFRPALQGPFPGQRAWAAQGPCPAP